MVIILTFKKWLKTFESVDHPIGDLARDVLSDKDFPNKINSVKDITEYLSSKRASTAAISTAENAYLYYSLDENLVTYVNNELVWRNKN
ncbi:hypothetical protein E5K23_002278 [Enterococcus faecalis]|nr:hypothetical protein [Enterococcus faecalis]EGO8202806.1 hypothetical protein [Enterococcus faecalis]